MLFFASMSGGLLALFVGFILLIVFVGIYAGLIWPLTFWDLASLGLEKYGNWTGTMVLSVFAGGAFAGYLGFSGNHDEVVAEALGLNTTLENLLQLPGSRVINYEPSLMLSLDEGCRLQCRLSIETRTNAYQIRTGQFPDAPISVYFTVRQYWGRSPYKTFVESYQNQRRICQDLVDNQIIPAIVRPLAQTIAAKQ